MADSTGDATGQHAEGVQHIASNTAPPTENSGVSGSEKFVSPLAPSGGSHSHGTTGTTGTTGSTLEPATSEGSQGGMMNTVKSYLGMGSGTAGNTVETGQLGTVGEKRNVEDHTIVEDHTAGSGSGAGLSGATASASSAAGLSEGNSAAGGGLGSTSASSGLGDSSTSGLSGDTREQPSPVGLTSDNTRSSSAGLTGGSSSTTGGSTLESAKVKVAEATPGTNSSKGEPEVTSGDSDHKPPKPASGKPGKLENESSIPTAGGERLGEKHWGESKIVPDDPSKRASAAGISSEEGQPTKQTTDNTAKNTGGAAGPPTSSSESHGHGGEEKPGMMEKVKDKLHMGKKE